MIVLHLSWLLHFVHDVSSNQYDRYAYGFSVEMGQTYITSVFDFPYHVMVVYGNLYCSGALLRSRIVITTAGCMTAGSKQRTFVKVGGNSITGLGQVIPVIDIKLHEYYRYYSRMDNDIAMLVLKENVQFSNRVKKVLLIEPDNDIEAGVGIEVSGWASQSLPQKYANLLLRTDMVIMKREDCVAVFKHLITPSNYCAKFHQERRVTDIGGPATHKQMLVGILSFAGKSEHKSDIAVFTNITYFHRWILLNTKRFLEKYCVLPKDAQDNSNHSGEMQISRVLFT